MAFNNSLTFTLEQGGLNTPQPGIDYVSGMIFKNATSIPSSFTYSTGQAIYSLVQAQNAGIVGNYSDETASKSLITVSATSSVGSTTTITIVEPSINGTYNTVTIGTYTTQASDVTLEGLATSISSFINTQFSNTGYTSTVPIGGSFSIVARTGLGSYINGTTPTITNVGYSGVAAGAFSGGVNSVRIEEWYQISEFFRQSPNGVLWIDYETTFGSFNCINTLQTQANNQINQFGIYNIGATTSAQIQSDMGSINTVCQTLFNNYAPAVVIYAPNLYSWGSNLSTLPNLRAFSDQYVSGIAIQDGANLGAFLSKMYGKSIPALGAVLGLCSSAGVSEDIGWVQSFNLSTGSELSTLAFSNGQLYSYLYSNQFNLLTQLDSYGWIFGMNRPNLVGSWVNDSHSAITITSDYAYIERNRTINKVSRLLYKGVAPYINGPIVINTDGTLNSVSIANITQNSNNSLGSMVQNGDISAFSIFVSPTQNVLSTGIVQIVVNIIPIAVGRSYQILLGFTTSL